MSECPNVSDVPRIVYEPNFFLNVVFSTTFCVERIESSSYNIIVDIFPSKIAEIRDIRT